MTSIYRVSKNTSQCEWFSLDESGHVLAEHKNPNTEKVFVIALDGRLVRSFYVDFPGRIKDPLTAAQFALEPSMAGSLDDQLFFLSRKSLTKEVHGFFIAKQDWDLMTPALAALPCLPKVMYPDYLFLPWSEGQVTIAHEGDSCRVRYSQYEGCVISTSSLALWLKGLSEERELDHVLVFSEDLSVDWKSVFEQPVIVLNEMAAWDIHTLPSPAYARIAMRAIPGYWKRTVLGWVGSKLCRWGLVSVSLICLLSLIKKNTLP